MTTLLDKTLKRQIAIGGADYTVSLDTEGFRLTGKGKRKPEIALRWSDLLNGDAALATALNASLTSRQTLPEAVAPASQTGKRPRQKSSR